MKCGKAIVYIQCYRTIDAKDGWWEHEKAPGTVGIDFFIGVADLLNRGVGSAMIEAFKKKLFENPAIQKIIAAPAPDNLRSIRCLEKAGFKNTGNITTPDGAAVLMVAHRDYL